MVVLALVFTLTICSGIVKADNYNYYYYSPPSVVPYPTIQVRINPSITYSTYYIPRTRYEWVPFYTQTLVKPAPMHGFRWLRQPTYVPTTEWRFVPVTRY